MAVSGVSTNPSYADIAGQIANSKASATTNTNTSTKATDNSTLGKDDFLKLLVTSLTYQDPSNPMDTGQMMQQMAMLGLMEQTTNMRTALEDLSKSQEMSKWQEASNLLGKTVEATNQSGETVTGEVKQVVNYDGTMYLLTDKDTFEIGDILSLKPGAETSNSKDTSTSTANVANAYQNLMDYLSA